MPRDVHRVGSVGVLDHLVHVRQRREVHDRIAALDGGADSVAIGEVRERGVDLALGVPGRRDEVEDPRLVACYGQLVDDVRADEARAAGNENLH